MQQIQVEFGFLVFEANGKLSFQFESRWKKVFFLRFLENEMTTIFLRHYIACNQVPVNW